VLYVTAEVLRQIAILAQPFMPASAERLLDLLAVPAAERTFAFLGDTHRLAASAKLPPPAPVFPRYVEAESSVANVLSPSKGFTTPEVSREEVKEFSHHCVHIRSVYSLMTRIWRDSDEGERRTMEAIAHSFFENLSQALAEFIINAACRLTEPAVDSRGNENFTLELFRNSFSADSETFKQLDVLLQRMMRLRVKILPARNKLGAHADRAVIRRGKPLGAASWKEWDDFWDALRDFVRILNEKATGEPFEIDAGGVLGDAEMLLKAFKQSQYFEKLLASNDPSVRKASLDVALSKD
jgi:AbiU2